MSESFELHAPDLFTTGAIGPPGQRVFYLQGREGRMLVTLKAEKEQVSALADYLAGLLERLGGETVEGHEEAPLLEPIQPAWAVGSIGVGYDEAHDRILIVANELVEGDEDEEEETGQAPAEVEGEGEAAGGEAEAAEEGASARFHVTRAHATVFVTRARDLMKAGRPTCRLCGRAIDPGGHLCGRRNGHGG
jgi:uncharacterized repeat protein (TIGR03847 family)